METATLFFRETNLDSAVPNFSCLLVAGARHMLQPQLMQTSLTVTHPDSLRRALPLEECGLCGFSDFHAVHIELSHAHD